MENYLLSYWLVPAIILFVFLVKSIFDDSTVASYSTIWVGVKLSAIAAVAIHVISYVAIQFGM